MVDKHVMMPLFGCSVSSGESGRDNGHGKEGGFSRDRTESESSMSYLRDQNTDPDQWSSAVDSVHAENGAKAEAATQDVNLEMASI